MPAYISDAERRARLVARHRLDRSARDVADAVRSTVALHSSDPLTPHLGAWARVPGFRREDLTTALCDDRSLCRMHGMRRTLFVVHRDDVETVEAAATRAIAVKERKRLRGWVEAAGLDVDATLQAATDAIRHALKDGERGTKELRAAIPSLGTPIRVGSGKWAQDAPLGSRLLYVLAMDGLIVRTRTSGWRNSQYAWADATGWFGRALRGGEEAEARAALLRRYLETHGPATMVDLRWWTGWTAARVKAALKAVDAEIVGMEGAEGFVLPGDLDTPAVAPGASLLPGLDSAPMGWKERDWFLDRHDAELFDRNGNVGPTVWWGGRIVGGWAARPGGVAVRLLEDVGSEAEGAIEAERAALTAWLDGEVPIPRFRTPLERALTR